MAEPGELSRGLRRRSKRTGGRVGERGEKSNGCGREERKPGRSSGAKDDRRPNPDDRGDELRDGEKWMGTAGREQSRKRGSSLRKGWGNFSRGASRSVRRKMREGRMENARKKSSDGRERQQ